MIWNKLCGESFHGNLCWWLSQNAFSGSVPSKQSSASVSDGENIGESSLGKFFVLVSKLIEQKPRRSVSWNKNWSSFDSLVSVRTDQLDGYRHDASVREIIKVLCGQGLVARRSKAFISLLLLIGTQHVKLGTDNQTTNSAFSHQTQAEHWLSSTLKYWSSESSSSIKSWVFETGSHAWVVF